jgi:hypothetical protein
LHLEAELQRRDSISEVTITLIDEDGNDLMYVNESVNTDQEHTPESEVLAQEIVNVSEAATAEIEEPVDLVHEEVAESDSFSNASRYNWLCIM